MVAPEGLPKYERICKENDIQALFDKGAGVSVSTFRRFSTKARAFRCILIGSSSCSAKTKAAL